MHSWPVHYPFNSQKRRHTYTLTLVHRFHEANELFDGTLNVLHNTILATDISNNEVYTYAQAIKQDDANEFVNAMEVEEQPHEQLNN